MTEGKEVVLLDIDPGQPMLTPAGLLSLTSLTTPLISNDPNNHSQNPLKTLFLDSSSPQSDMSRYLEAVKVLLMGIEGAGKKYVLVNTCGWVDGLGQEL